MVSTLRYQMVIVWSDENGCYLVHFPDFPEQTYRTHGDSYAEARRFYSFCWKNMAYRCPNQDQLLANNAGFEGDLFRQTQKLSGFARGN